MPPKNFPKKVLLVYLMVQSCLSQGTVYIFFIFHMVEYQVLLQGIPPLLIPACLKTE